MPFSGSVFTLPNGATNAQPGQIVQSAIWNAIHSDIQTGLTQVMSQLVTTPGMRNLVGDNGSFDVWQRGAGGSASIAVPASTIAYTADRWYLSTGSNQASVVSQQAGLVNPSQFSAKVLRNNGQTGTTNVVFAYPFDSYESVNARGNFVTLTFVIKAGANWSPTNGTINYVLYCGTGAAAKRNATPYTSETTPITGSVNITTSNTVVSVQSTIAVPTSTVQMELQLNWTPVGTAGVDDSFTIDEVQLEVDYSSATWTPTSYDRRPFEYCYEMCKRHYQKIFPYTTAPAQNTGSSVGAIILFTQAATNQSYSWRLCPGMRAIPSVTSYAPNTSSANWFNISTTTTVAATIDPFGADSADMVYVISAATSAGVSLSIYLTASAGI